MRGKKEKAFQSCLPIFEIIQKASLDNDIYNNIQQIPVTLGMDVHVSDGLENVFKSIVEDIQKLKHYLEEKEKKFKHLQKRLDNIESKSLLRDIQIDAYELVRLFQFYYVNDIIHKKFPRFEGWGRFTGKLMIRTFK